jgi:hypothetical protein
MEIVVKMFMETQLRFVKDLGEEVLPADQPAVPGLCVSQHAQIIRELSLTQVLAPVLLTTLV